MAREQASDFAVPGTESQTTEVLTRVMKRLKAYLRPVYRAPYSVYLRAVNAAKKLPTIFTPRRAVFTEMYGQNAWGGAESKSGPGSDLKQTETIREQLPILVASLGVKSFLDVPCGDFHWMREIDLPVEEYIGADIVQHIVDDNRKKYATRNRTFLTLDITGDRVPTVDLIFCRDMLVHFPLQDIHRAIKSFKRSGSEYLLTTTFPRAGENDDIPMGLWRPLNLQLPPFNFSAPIKLINENCTENEGRYADKSLGLWKISELP